MAETSFPIVEKNLGPTEWQSIMSALGHGVLDYGGFPYRVTNVDDVADQMTIGVDSIRKKNEAVIAGFGHEITAPKVLDLPPVATTTTYEIGLLYDPTQHAAVGGPVKLVVLTTPVDVTEGRVWVVLYRVTRAPSQALSAATRVENRQRISPQIVVSGTADLPPTSEVLVDTVARVRVTGERWAAAISADGVVSWQKVDGGRDPLLTSATWDAVPDTVMKRASNGSVWAAEGNGELSVINKKWIADNSTGGIEAGAEGKLVARGTDKNFLVPNTPTNGNHPLSWNYAEGRYYRHNIDNLNADKLNSGGPPVPFALVDGSYHARDVVQSGTVYTVSVNGSTGRLMRFSSKRADKDEIKPLTIDPRRVLAPEVVQYRRRDHETGEVPEGARVEWGYIADDELVREDGVPELVLTEPNEDGTPRAEGWDNAGLTAGHHKVLQWLTARADAVDRHLGIDTSGVQA